MKFTIINLLLYQFIWKHALKELTKALCPSTTTYFLQISFELFIKAYTGGLETLFMIYILYTKSTAERSVSYILPKTPDSRPPE